VRESEVDEIVHNCLAARVRLISRAITEVYDRALDGHGLSVAQVNLLAALGKVGPCAPTNLGGALHLERSTVSRNLSLLMKHGWIEPTSSDAKGVREVALTRAGRKKIDAAMPDWRHAQDRAAQLLGTEGVEAIRMIANSLGQLPSG
jgi:DNA-binding MarR family transcriptional regulator